MINLYRKKTWNSETFSYFHRINISVLIIWSIQFLFLFPFAQSSFLNSQIMKTHHHTCVHTQKQLEVATSSSIIYFCIRITDHFSCLILISTQSNSRSKLCISINVIHQNMFKPLKAENRKQIKNSYIIMIDYIDWLKSQYLRYIICSFGVYV